MTSHNRHQQQRDKRSRTRTQKVYSRPCILQELTLETRAGSPLGVPNPLDPAGIDPAD